jgi:DnaK suppressor protein
LAKRPAQKSSRASKPKKRAAASTQPPRRTAAKRPQAPKVARTGSNAAAKVKVIARARATDRPSGKAGADRKPPRDKVVPQRLGTETRHAANRAAPVEVEIEGRSETFLTPEEVEQFRHMLLDKRAEILGDVSTLHNEALNKDRRDAAGDLSSMPIHMADLGTDNYELEFTLGLIEGERAILREIDEALERIRQGTYGVCLATGKPIGKARLKAKPWARYCYEYTLAQEQGQARRF